MRLDVEQLSFSYDARRTILEHVTFSLAGTGIYCILGKNGTGKSTLLKCIVGEHGGTGRVLLDGKDRAAYGQRELARKIAYIPQNHTPTFPFRVLDVVMMGRTAHMRYFGSPGAREEEQAHEHLRFLGIDHLCEQPYTNISGGELQLVLLAAALTQSPAFLILDEPTTGLDPGTRSKVWRIISKLREDYKMTIFLTTHYMEEAADADYVTILDKGRIIAEGTPLELKTQYATDVLHLYGVNESEVKKLKIPYQKIHKDFQIKVKNSAVVTQLIVKNPELFQDFELIKSTLDDVFLAVTKSRPGADISKSKITKIQTEQKS